MKKGVMRKELVCANQVQSDFLYKNIEAGSNKFLWVLDAVKTRWA